MPRNDIQKLILDELRGLKTEVSDIRTKDIPDIKTHIGTYDTKLETLKEKQAWSMRIYTLVGGALAVVASRFTGHHGV